MRYDDQKKPTGAVILEIRSPTGKWETAMDEIYGALKAGLGSLRDFLLSQLTSLPGRR